MIKQQGLAHSRNLVAIFRIPLAMSKALMHGAAILDPHDLEIPESKPFPEKSTREA